MSKDVIRYDLLVQDALKGVVRKLLGDAARDGLLGEHHFYVSFRTDFPGVRVSNHVREKYPQDMTIVLQHQFWDLGVTEHTFEVGLSFSGRPERLLIPFDAVTGFFDPSVQFGLKFEIGDGSTEVQDGAAGQTTVGAVPDLAKPAKAPTVPSVTRPVVPAKPGRAPNKAAEPKLAEKPAERPAKQATNEDEAPATGAEVVSLDAFRKKS